MIRRLLKWTLIVMAVNTVIWLVGTAITRSKTSKDLTADDVQFYTFWNGQEFRPLSSALRRVKAKVLMAGATVDLRDAIPADDGLEVAVSTTMGGTAVLVRKDWKVEVDQQTTAGEVQVDVNGDSDLSEDSPKVHITLSTAMGGGYVGYELPKDWQT